MEDINNYIKENDTDNVILNKLKELGTKLTGQENVQGETVSEVLDFINSNYSGGGSSGGATYLSINAELDDNTTNSFEVINLDSLYHITPTYFNVTYTNKTESGFGGFSVGIYDSSEHSFGGVIPCTYNDTNGSHTGVLMFNARGFIMLYPNEDVTELNGDISIYTSGTLFADIG